MGLRRLARLDENLWLGRGSGFCGRRGRSCRDPVEQLREFPVGQVGRIPGDDHGPLLARPAAGPKREQVLPVKRSQGFRGTENRPSERMVAVCRGVDQYVGQCRRLIVGPRDLLDHDTTLDLQVLGPEARTAHEVGQEICRVEGALAANADVKGDVIGCRVRVQLRPQPVCGAVDVVRAREALPSFEHSVLEEMSHAVLFSVLYPGAGVERDQDRNRSRSRGGDPDDRHTALVLDGGDGCDWRTLSSRAIPPSGVIPAAQRAGKKPATQSV